MAKETKRSASPRFVQPMAAELITKLPDGDEWIYEVKWDGYRALLIKDCERVELRSRNASDFSLKFHTVTEAAAHLNAAKLTLDGEIVALGKDGRPSFQALQHASQSRHRIVFYAFDALHLNGRDLLGRSLAERRATLQRIVPRGHPTIRLSEGLGGSAEEIVAAMRAAGVEGVIAKRKDSPYQPGERSGDWVKLKLDQQQELVIGGYRPNGASIDALLMGFYDGKDLMFAGKVRAGFVPHVRRELGTLLRPLHTAQCPFVNLPDARLSRWGAGVTAQQMKEMKWVKPHLVAQIRFVEWTADHRLRHAGFIGLRTDKLAGEVRR
jgi:bifunctional non-homologous end joining protein LigD